MKITVLGAQGMLGHDVMMAAANEGHEVTGCGHAEVDITDPDQVGRRLRLDRPDAVVNCAAWTDVDGAEDEPEGAMAVNGAGAGTVAEAAAAVDAKVLYVSSDYVFDGSKTEPYVGTDQTGPISAYGRSKLAGEVATLNANRRAFVVRSSWLFGVAGGNFVDTMIRLGSTQKQVLVVNDQIGCPTYTWHLAYGLVRLLDSDAYGIHHMAAGGHCSWYDFAREIFRQMKMEVTTLSATTGMFAAKAPRPAWSVLESARQHPITLPEWQDGLTAYLEQRRSREEALS